LGKYLADYLFCDTCGFLSVKDPHWLAEAYSSAIAAADTGLVARNLSIARWLSPLCRKIGAGPFLDYGGGSGLLVRLMRDRGHDFRWQDPYAQNILAQGFEQTGPVTAITAFDVLEHVENPIETLEHAFGLAGCGTIIFSQELFDGEPPETWWFYAPEHGQHISFYRADTLARITQKLSLRLVSHRNIHILTDRDDITASDLRGALSRTGQAVGLLRDRFGPSLTQTDHEMMLTLSGTA
jgi:hypothetical protein